MLLRKITKTEFGDVVDFYPGHIPEYLLLVRIDDSKVSELEASLPKGYRPSFFANMGDRRGYSFEPMLTSEQMKDITDKLVELGAQSFEFRDWRNKISPPTREKVIKTEKPIY